MNCSDTLPLLCSDVVIHHRSESYLICLNPVSNVDLILQAMTRVNPTVYNSIASLSNEPNTTVVVFSGSDKAKLDEVFGNLNVWLAAENGIFMRPPPDEDGDQEVWSLQTQSPFINPVPSVVPHCSSRSPIKDNQDCFRVATMLRISDEQSECRNSSSSSC